MTDTQKAILLRFLKATGLAVAVTVGAAVINFLQSNSLSLPDAQQQIVTLVLIPSLATFEQWLMSFQAVQVLAARLRR